MKNIVSSLVPYPIANTLKNAIRFFESLFYVGHQYECPFCKHQYRKLLSGGEQLPFYENHQIIGGGRRLNMLCPRCHSTDRDRLIYYYLTSNNLLVRGQYSLLHMAPEPSLKKYLKKFSNIAYSCGDKFENGYKGFYYDKETRLLDLTALPYPDECFDVVICNHVLEHIGDEKKALKEVFRVLKQTGWAILQVPIDNGLEQTIEQAADSEESRMLLYGQRDHVRLYGLDYPARLRAQGFNVEEWSPVKQGEQKQIDRYAINPLEKVFIASK